jgi:hypothetical protein
MPATCGHHRSFFTLSSLPFMVSVANKEEKKTKTKTAEVHI